MAASHCFHLISPQLLLVPSLVVFDYTSCDAKMSFSFAVGDIWAVIQVCERVADEIRNYRDAPRNFQQLGDQLHLFQQTLRYIADEASQDAETSQQLDTIKAIADHCLRPIQAFLDTMKTYEDSLGPSKSFMSMGRIGKRWHWSVKYLGQVDGLRQLVMSDMVAIIAIQGTQQRSDSCGSSSGKLLKADIFVKV